MCGLQCGKLVITITKNISSNQRFSKSVTFTKFLPKMWENLVCTVWKNEKFSLTKKLFREINSLVTYSVKALLSQNFWQKMERDNFRNFHTVVCHTFGITEIYSHWKNFRQINFFSKIVVFTKYLSKKCDNTSKFFL